MDEILLVNDVLERMRASWAWGWVKWDAKNSYEPAAEYHDHAEFDAAWETAKGRGERCSFYRCPLCGEVTCQELSHLLCHNETWRVWVDREMVYIYPPGSCKAGGLQAGVLPVHIGKYTRANTSLVSTVKDFLAKKATFAELKAAVS